MSLILFLLAVDAPCRL